MKSKITKSILLLSSFITVFGLTIACGTTPEIKTPAKQNENAKPLPKKPNLDNQNNLSSDKKEEQNNQVEDKKSQENNPTLKNDNKEIKSKPEDQVKTPEPTSSDNTTQETPTTPENIEPTLFQEQQKSIKKINTFTTLASSLKLHFAQQINEQTSTQDLKKIEEKVSELSNLSTKLSDTIKSAEAIKSTPKYTSTTNNADKLLDITLLKAQSFFHNQELVFSSNISDLELQINAVQKELIDAQKALNGTATDEQISQIKTDLEQVNPSFDEAKIKLYRLEDKLNPVAFDVETTKLLTKIGKEGYSFEIKDTKLDNSNNNKIEITYQVTNAQGHRTRISKLLDFKKDNTYTYDIESKISALDTKFQHLDDLYDFDKIALQQINKEHVGQLQDIIKQNFRSKGNKVDHIFQHDLAQISYENEHFSAKVNFLALGKIVKQITLQTKDKITLRSTSMTKLERDKADLQLLISSYLTNVQWNKDNLSGSEQILKDLQPIKQGVDHHGIPSMLAEKELNNIYKWPKIGKYSLFVKEVLDHSNIFNSNRGGTVKLIFGIKKDNQELNFQDWDLKITESDYKTTYAKNMWYFRPLRVSDIELPSNWVSPNFDEAHKKLIDEINASNFDLRKTPGAKVNGKETLFSVLNPQQLVSQFRKQDAGSALQYLLKLKNNHNNNTQNDSSEFKRTLDESKDATGGDEFDKQSIQAKIDNSANVFVVNTNSIIPSGVTTNPNNISDIINDYFIVYYDVKSERTGELKFKIGFINKSDPSKVYSKSEEITLVNLSNDFQNNIYPELLMNKVSLQDFQYNNQQLTWNKQTLTLNNYSIDTKDITIHETVEYNNNTYINLKYTYPNQKKETEKIVVGNNWYKVAGSNSVLLDDIKNSSFKWRHSGLNTLIVENYQVIRNRQIEFNAKDAIWSQDGKGASWVLKEKYLEKMLENARDVKLDLTIYGNVLIQDDNRYNRFTKPGDPTIHGSEGNYKFPSFTIDYSELKRMSNHNIELELPQRYNNTNSSSIPLPKLTLLLNVTKKLDGLHFKLSLKGEEYSIIVGNPINYVNTTQGYNPFTNNDKFDKNRAFILWDRGAGVNVIYENYEQYEEHTRRTNLFDYKQISYTQENAPIPFYTDPNVRKNVYFPNQNVPYEIHNGYLQNNDYINYSTIKSNPQFENNFQRALAFSFGSATMIGKVNNDENDWKFYFITNNHVENVKNFDQLNNSTTGLPNTYRRYSYIVKSSLNFENNVNAGFSYWGGLLKGPNSSNNTKPKPTQGQKQEEDPNSGFLLSQIWSGLDQQSRDGKEHKGHNIDATIFVVDVKPLYDEALAQGKYEYANWLKSWLALENMKFNFNGMDYNINHQSLIYDFSIVGFPYGKQSAYVIHRPGLSNYNVMLRHQNGYVPTYFDAGNSGTGILSANNNYISLINSGTPGNSLQGWNYATRGFNYFGVNFNGEHPLDLKNTKSFAAQILRWHLLAPASANSPWFFNPFKTNTK
ncbi:MGA_1079 family surface serine endopeptidase [Mesomycoplasma ovipneumoniae]|uniref:MGA_1079 family surface serine endopeptidase n=1 Tax=Mesomycoplasma ovipneumoniae TaxID=29562 RepID=UPI003080369C